MLPPTFERPVVWQNGIVRISGGLANYGIVDYRMIVFNEIRMRTIVMMNAVRIKNERAQVIFLFCGSDQGLFPRVREAIEQVMSTLAVHP